MSMKISASFGYGFIIEPKEEMGFFDFEELVLNELGGNSLFSLVHSGIESVGTLSLILDDSYQNISGYDDREIKLYSYSLNKEIDDSIQAELDHIAKFANIVNKDMQFIVAVSHS